VVQTLYRDHLSGVGRHGAILWAVLVLAHWSERYLRPVDVAQGLAVDNP
jgi:hypothetical protein